MRHLRNAWLATRLGALDPADADRLTAVVPLLEALVADEASSLTP